MFGKILFCDDFSEQAIASSACIPKIPGPKTVILLHVVDAASTGKRGWTFEPEIVNARLVLEELKQELESAGLTVRTRLEVITSGDVTSAILEVADEERPDLVLMGARGRGLVQGLLFGSVSRAVLRRSHHDILIFRKNPDRESCPDILSKILIPTDFSVPAEAAIEKLEKVPGIGEAVLLHVVTRGDTHEEIEALVAGAERRLGEFSGRFGAARVSTHVRIGNPVDEILKLAGEERVEMVYMSSHGEGMVQTILLGSTSFEVAERARCPVWVSRYRPRE